jgi:hypothetical protein
MTVAMSRRASPHDGFLFHAVTLTVIGPAAMEGFAWEGADEHLDRLAARIPGARTDDGPTTSKP